jgi:hypothetical protein
MAKPRGLRNSEPVPESSISGRPPSKAHIVVEDRAEAHQAGFADGLLGCEAAFAFGMQGEVDQHDSVLLDDADQENDADDADHVEAEPPPPAR